VLGIVRAIGALTLGVLREMGRMSSFLFYAVYMILRRPGRPIHVVKQVHFIGAKSFFVIFLTAAFTGMVLGLQLYYTLNKLMVTGRAGSAITAEIGIKRITEQIDALETMALDPFKYLVSPKMLGAVIALPLLCAVYDVVGIYGGYLVGVKLLGVNPGAYLAGIENDVEWKDVYSGIVKSLSFGVIIAWVCCYKGYYASHGAEGVSRATTAAVVMSSVLVLIWDYFLTSVLM